MPRPCHGSATASANSRPLGDVVAEHVAGLGDADLAAVLAGQRDQRQLAAGVGMGHALQPLAAAPRAHRRENAAAARPATGRARIRRSARHRLACTRRMRTRGAAPIIRRLHERATSRAGATTSMVASGAFSEPSCTASAARGDARHRRGCERAFDGAAQRRQALGQRIADGHAALRARPLVQLVGARDCRQRRRARVRFSPAISLLSRQGLHQGQPRAIDAEALAGGQHDVARVVLPA